MTFIVKSFFEKLSNTVYVPIKIPKKVKIQTSNFKNQ